MTNLNSILKSGDISLPTKVRIVKTMVFPEIMYGYEAEPHSLILSNCAGEVSRESFGQQRDETSPS